MVGGRKGQTGLMSATMDVLTLLLAGSAIGVEATKTGTSGEMVMYGTHRTHCLIHTHAHHHGHHRHAVVVNRIGERTNLVLAAVSVRVKGLRSRGAELADFKVWIAVGVDSAVLVVEDGVRPAVKGVGDAVDDSSSVGRVEKLGVVQAGALAAKVGGRVGAGAHFLLD